MNYLFHDLIKFNGGGTSWLLSTQASGANIEVIVTGAIGVNIDWVGTFSSVQAP